MKTIVTVTETPSWFEYAGNFKKDLKNGFGKLTFPNQDIYTGQWRND